jgi:DNA polymerase-3 subunit epsilon/exodeoxyribonuclease X
MLIYLDLETTGLEATDRICAAGLIAYGDDQPTVISDLVKPPKKIRPDAMAVHHITNEMVKAKPPAKDSESLQWLKAHNSSDHTLVSHNIRFDLDMLQREGVVWQGGSIDTLKCTRHLIDDLEHYSLQYLRYELGLYKQEVDEAKRLGITLNAHMALSDAYHTMLLHRYLRELADDEALMEMTHARTLLKKFTFGKYSGRYIEEIAMAEPGYLYWMLENMQDLDSDLEYTIRHHLGC